MTRHARNTAVWSTIGLLVALWPATGLSAPPDEPPKAEDPNTPSLQRPSSTSGAPQPTDEAPTEDPSPEAGATPPVEATTAPGDDDSTPPSNPENSPGLLAPSQDEPVSHRPSPVGSDPVQGGISRDEKSKNFYDELYRPDHNPARFNFGARALFMAAGAKESRVSGRMAGLTLEAGHSWNWIGYAVTGTLYGGQTLFGPAQEHEFNLLVGGGPTLSLGRLALVRNGFLDARIGYDFFYAPAKVSSIGISDGVASAPANVTPHGPRLRVDLGLLLHGSAYRKRRHGIGASFGYQMLIGSFTGELARSNVLMVGLNYFMG